MFLPPEDFQANHYKKIRATAEQPVCLRAEHLILHCSLCDLLFGKDGLAYMVYYDQRQMLLVAPFENKTFQSIHKARQYLLKEVSPQEKAIALHAILLDNNLNAEDRVLPFEQEDHLGFLSVFL